MVTRDPSKRLTPAAQSALLRDVVRLRHSEQTLLEQNEDLVEAHALLADARDDFAELYDCAPLPLLTLGMRGVIRSANLATAELFERERSWLIGRSFRMLFHELDRPRLTPGVTFGKGFQQCVARLILPDESWFEVLLTQRGSPRKIGVLHIGVADLRTGRHIASAAGDTQRRARARRRILVIEDHLETAETMQEVLEQHGYAVVAADSVGAAVDVDLSRVDAILSDILLPDGLGTDLLRQLRRERDVPAIAFSGLTKSTDLERAKDAGFDLFLSKPVDFPRLLTALGTLLTAPAPDAPPRAI